MLSPDKFAARPSDFWAEDDRPGRRMDVGELLAMGRRQWRVVAGSAAACLVAGAVYLLTAVPLYTATVNILVDRGSGGVANRLSQEQPMLDDDASVLSQVELLKSDNIGLAVVDRLRLAEAGSFLASAPSLLAAVAAPGRSMFGEETGPQPDRRVEALNRLMSGLDVTRVGRSYVVAVSFASPSPKLSADIVGAIADAYLADKLEAKYDATRRAGVWLQQRIDALRQQSIDSDLAVQKFRTRTGLLSARAGMLITDQQLSELNSALIVARADTARAKARYERIAAIVASGQSDAIVTDVLDSSVSNELRKKYLVASKLEAEIAGRLGHDHIRAQRLRAEMADYRRLMFEELARIAESYRSDYTVAQSREQSLLSSVAAARQDSASAGETQVQLRELERTAETYRTLYQSFLQRFQESVQQQSFPITEARIIARPSPPMRPSHPRRLIVLGVSTLLGCLLGATLATVREAGDRCFRTAPQVRRELGLDCLGQAPLLAETSRAVHADTPPRHLRRASALAGYVTDHPMSPFAEMLRKVRVAIDSGRSDGAAKVIGIVSSLPSEGKSILAMNLAQLLAMQGDRALLIDCDMRNPGATRAIGAHAEAGLIEILLQGRPLRDLLLVDPQIRFGFLPLVIHRDTAHASELLASKAMDTLMQTARENFDYVVLDLPPLTAVVDASVVSSFVDAFVFVVEWGRTPIEVVRSTLAADPLIAEKCLGIILNKVDPRRVALYQPYGSPEADASRYRAYYSNF